MTAMPIEIKCPTCEKEYLLADTQAGKRVRCRNCADSFLVPGQAREVPDRDDEILETLPVRPQPRQLRQYPRSNESGFPWVLVSILGGICLAAATLVIGLLIWSHDKFKLPPIQVNPANPPPVAVAPPPPPVAPPPRKPDFDPNNPFAVPKTVDQALQLLVQPNGTQRRSGADFLSREKVNAARQNQVARALEKQYKEEQDAVARDGELRALLVWADSQTANLFLQLLSTTQDNTTWNSILDILVKQKDLRAAPIVARDLNNLFRRSKAAEVLRTFGPVAEKDVVKLMNHTDPSTRNDARNLLKQWKSKPELLNAQSLADLKADEPTTKSWAAQYFSEAAVDPKIQAEVSRALEPLALSQDFRTKEAGIKALLLWATRDSAATLNTLMETERRHRDKIMKVLAGWKDPKALVLLLKMFGSGSPVERQVAHDALKSYGPEIEPSIQPLLQEKDILMRREAVILLGEIGTKASLPMLEQARQDKKLGGVVEQAIKAINNRG
jgi:HEAT repeat protein